MNKITSRLMGLGISIMLLFEGFINGKALSSVVYYVATTGSDSNAGTLTAPFGTIAKAVSVVPAGGTIVVRGGQYVSPQGGWSFANSGTSAAPITLTNYSGEQVVFKDNDTTSGNNYPVFRCEASTSDPASWRTTDAQYIKILGTDGAPSTLSDGVVSRKGIVIQGVTGNQDSVIRSNGGCSNWEIAGLDFVEVGDAIYTFTAPNDTDGWYVHDNRVYNFYRESGMQFNGNNNVIENNTVDKVSAELDTPYGCQMLDLQGHGNEVSGNTFTRGGSNAACSGLMFEWDLSDANVIENNTFSDFNQAIDFEGGDSNSIRNNTMIATAGTTQAAVDISSYDNQTEWPCDDTTSPPAEDLPYLSNPHNCHSQNNQVYNNNIVGFPSIVAMSPVADGSNQVYNNSASLTSTPALTQTATPTPTSTATQTAPTPTNTLLPSPTFTGNPPTATLQSTATSQPVSEVTYDDTYSDFMFSSNWPLVTNSQAYNGKYKYTSLVNSYVTLAFSGVTFSVVYTSGPGYGNMDVYVDDQKVGSINQQSTDLGFQQHWDYGSQLSSGGHTLKLVFTGPANTEGTLDAVIVVTSTSGATQIPPTPTNTSLPSPTFTVKPPTPTNTSLPTSTSTQIPPTPTNTLLPSPTSTVKPPTPTNTKAPATATLQSTATSQSVSKVTYDDTYANFMFSSNWPLVTNSQAYDGKYKYTSLVNSYVTLAFSGVTFSVVYTAGPGYGNMDVYVDDQKVGSINQQSAALSFQQHWDYGSQLSSGGHTLKLVFTGPSKTEGTLDAVIVVTSTSGATQIPPTPTSTVKPPTPTNTALPSPTFTIKPPTPTNTLMPNPTSTANPPTPTNTPLPSPTFTAKPPAPTNTPLPSPTFTVKPPMPTNTEVPATPTP